MDDLVTRLLGRDGCCPFCERDPYHYVDIGVGMQAAAVICCDMGIDYFQGGDSLLDKQMGLRREAADRITAQATEIERLRGALNQIDIEAGNTIPPDGLEAAHACLFRIAQIINPFRIGSLTHD